MPEPDFLWFSCHLLCPVCLPTAHFVSLGSSHFISQPSPLFSSQVVCTVASLFLSSVQPSPISEFLRVAELFTLLSVYNPGPHLPSLPCFTRLSSSSAPCRLLCHLYQIPCGCKLWVSSVFFALFNHPFKNRFSLVIILPKQNRILSDKLQVFTFMDGYTKICIMYLVTVESLYDLHTP